METMATSMADHLREQEYSRIRNSAKAMLTEPPVTEEAAAILADAYEAYERDETSPEEYLSIVTEQRGFTPVFTEHAVMINSGSYCSNTGLPIIIKAFLNDNNNAAVKDVLGHYRIVILDKIPSGGVLIHVRSTEDEAKLDGHEVNLMGRKFTIKRRSFLMNKFFLDVSGIHSVEEANAIFLALGVLGAHPLFLTPRDVNMETRVVTPTWRFYFGSETTPKCLVVDRCITHQLIYGRNLYLARGKRSIAGGPPVRATRRQSRYGVVLPFEDDYPSPNVRKEGRSHPHASHRNEPEPSVNTSALILAHKSSVNAASTKAGVSLESNHELGHEVMSSNPHGLTAHQERVDSSNADLEAVVSYTGAIEDAENQWTTQGDDIDMSKQLETGFKRLEPSFVHENPYTALYQPECEFEIVHPDPIEGVKAGVFIIPHLKTDEDNEYPRPTPSKKQATLTDHCDKDVELLLEEALLQSEQEAQLIKRGDQVAANVKRFKAAEALLKESKNMDLIVKSICEVPVAWTTAFLKDIALGGAQMMNLADIHLLNRVSAAEGMDDEKMRTFHDRISSLNLPVGNTREQYITYLKDAVDHLPTNQHNEWNILRWLSLFELLALGMCPSVFTQHRWMEVLMEHASEGLLHSHVKLISDGSLLKLLRSSLGNIILNAVNQEAPVSAIVQGLSALQASNLSSSDLAILSTNLLKFQSATPAIVAGTSN
ncbi:hypothetical protein P3T76_008344 [Phytophthora citrophthora]|uniref:Uncharacterized protein n=1 Tax=Phytophthora citrophthora TaxID=4793 RepID=A0AAD9GL08_9STRA|nr:hypothetical protein P3T76_008344 [Phytophthora citrophthora]